MFDTGVVIGKFYPPHIGHRFLIESAQKQCRKLTVIICAKVSENIPGEARLRWMQSLYPKAQAILIEDVYPEEDSRLWAQKTIEWLGYIPNACFTSEEYGTRWAQYMGCQHIAVDPARSIYPISATRIRQDPLAHWQWLEKPVRAWFARRIVVLGAESTGTTTLARDLAKKYQTNWVEEYGREYWQDRSVQEPQSAEFLHIARTQGIREDAAAENCNKILICDTDAFTTRLWHWRYLGTNSKELDSFVQSRPKPSLYLLTGDEIPFVQDGTRDGERIRHLHHQKFEEELTNSGIPYYLLAGSPLERMSQAKAHIDTLLESN